MELVTVGLPGDGTSREGIEAPRADHATSGLRQLTASFVVVDDLWHGGIISIARYK